MDFCINLLLCSCLVKIYHLVNKQMKSTLACCRIGVGYTHKTAWSEVSFANIYHIVKTIDDKIMPHLNCLGSIIALIWQLSVYPICFQVLIAVLFVFTNIKGGIIKRNARTILRQHHWCCFCYSMCHLFYCVAKSTSDLKIYLMPQKLTVLIFFSLF